MFISVDLPAPFSPRSACTSRRRISKSTWSLATTPGKTFVMPLSSRRGVSSIGERGGGGTGPPPREACLRHGLGDRDLPVDDHLLLLLDLVEEGLLDLVRDLAEPDAVLREAERGQAALELAGGGLLDRLEDGLVDALDGAR